MKGTLNAEVNMEVVCQNVMIRKELYAVRDVLILKHVSRLTSSTELIFQI